MSWHRKYHFFLIFGDTTGSLAPWSKEIWKEKIQPELDLILKRSIYHKKTGLSTLQYVPRPNTTYYETVKLGRLSWNENSHDKWTLTTMDPSRQFHHMDIWTPSRGGCEKLNSAPDIYFSICNEKASYNLSHTEFEWLAVLAVAVDIPYDIKSYVHNLSRAMNAKKALYRERGWLQQMQNSHWRFVNGIQDTFSNWIYGKTHNEIHKTPFQDLQFAPFWETIFDAR